jgi:hypothetical protein
MRKGGYGRPEGEREEVMEGWGGVGVGKGWKWLSGTMPAWAYCSTKYRGRFIGSSIPCLFLFLPSISIYLSLSSTCSVCHLKYQKYKSNFCINCISYNSVWGFMCVHFVFKVFLSRTQKSPLCTFSTRT